MQAGDAVRRDLLRLDRPRWTRRSITLDAQGLHLDTLRIAPSFHDDVHRFRSPRTIRSFVIEQNRDAQLRTLLITEGEIDPAKLIRCSL